MTEHEDESPLDRERERLNAARLDAVPDWIWEVDADAVFTYSNRVVEDILGIGAGEVVGRRIFDLLAPEDQPKCRGVFEEAIAGKRPAHNIISRFVRTDGEIRTVEVSCVPMIQDDGIVGLRGIARDITDTLPAQRAAQEALANYRAALDNSPTGMVIIQNERVVYVNPEMLRLMGYTAEETLGRDIWGFIHAEDRERVKDHYRRRMAGLESPEYYELRALTKSGEVRHFELRATVITYQGAPAVLDNVIDVTERKRAEDALRESEEKSRNLVENTSDWVWEIDENNVYTYAGSRVRDLLGYEPDEVLGRTPFEFMAPDDAGRARAQFESVRSRREPFSLLDNTLIRRDGRPVDVETSGTPILDSEGVFRGYRGIDRDVTERRRYLERITRLNECFLGFGHDATANIRCLTSIAGELMDATCALYGRVEGGLLCSWGQWQAEPRSIPDSEECSEGDVCRELIGTVSDEPLIMRGIQESEQARTLPCTSSTGLRTCIGTPVRFADHTVGALYCGYEYDVAPSEADIRFLSVIASAIAVEEERSCAEAAMRQKEERFRLLAETATDAIVMIDQDSTIIYANPTTERVFGYRPDEIMGKSLTMLMPERLREAHTKAMRRLIETGERSRPWWQSIEVTGLHKDGREIPLEVSYGGPVVEDNYLFTGIVRDITARKQAEDALKESEERYRLLFERSPEIVLVMKGSVFIESSPAVTKVLGYSPQEIVGMQPWEISPELQPDGKSSREKAQQMIESAQSGEPQFFEWVHRRKDGLLLDCEVSLTTYRVRGEQFVQAIVRDVTERKREEEHRRAFERQVELQKRQFYRDTILSVTDGKLDICDAPEIRPYVSTADLRITLRGASEVAGVRREIERYCAEHGLEGERLDSFVIAVGEAATNAVKHASGGRVYAGVREGAVWAGVADRGTGISSLILPRATLLRGFSTKPSLGLGYTIMLGVADTILLRTGDRGTTVILTKQIEELETVVSPNILPDTWRSVPDL